MSTLTIKNLDDALQTSLRAQAAHHGRSIEEEVHAILRHALSEPATAKGLGQRLLQRFEHVAGDELVLPRRSLPRQSVDWDASA